jgi:aspartyl aminopeptidase
MIKTVQMKQADKLIDFLYKNPTAGYFVFNTAHLLKKSGFEELNLSEPWKNLSTGKNYFVNKDDAAIFAFKIPSAGFTNGFRIVGAHIDSPGIKIKPNPEILKDGYLQLNTEIYGGPILSTWFDRPLCAAGKIYCKGDNPFSPLCKLININRPIGVIPNLAIHMNRDVNRTASIDNQKHLLPVLKTVFDKKFSTDGVLLKIISKESGIDVKDILDFELYLYDYNKGAVFGLDNEFISSSRIDDQQSAYAGITALTETKRPGSIHLLACFDNEEVGSATKQGADSQVLSNLMERIVLSLKGSRKTFLFQ